MDDFPPIVAITGPTAVGKSAIALRLATRFGAEIVSVDSRQVYRYLDIGTAKPSAAERGAVPHHLLDLVDPDGAYSATVYRTDADRVLLDIKARGGIAFMVGGTGLYLDTVLDRLAIPSVPPNPDFRRQMEELARVEGAGLLHARLAALDPEAGDFVDGRNVRRVIRALEVIHETGLPFSEVGRMRGEPVPALRLALTTDRTALHRRIDDRVEQQIRDGLFEEARAVLERGFEPSLPPLAGLVYREAIAVVQGRMTAEDAAYQMKVTTHAYARRQYTWLRRHPEVEWHDTGQGLEEELGDVILSYLDRR